MKLDNYFRVFQNTTTTYELLLLMLDIFNNILIF